MFVEGRLSNFFYRVARLRVMLGLKLNIEMLWLPDEMFSQRAGTSAFSWATRFPSPSCSVTADSASRPNSYAKRRIFWKICSRRNRKNAKIGIFAPSYMQQRQMEAIIPPVERELLRAELTPERKARDTKKAGNEIYIFSAAECPSLMREIGRLREIAFRGAGGGTGKELDIDAEDLAEDGYYQLIVWDPAAEEIVGGYRFIICTDEYPRHLSTEHYFRFSDKFRRKYLPRTIELGRSFVQPSYQARGNAKSIYALDNLWDGLGALIVLDPRAKYLFGKVTMYTTYKAVARNALIWFLRRYFPDRDNLVEGIHPLRLDLDDPYYEQLFTGQTYQENYRILIQKIREFNENIPPLINAYMNLSPTMRVFDTVSNPDFGGVEETGILVTIRDIYPEKRERYTRWLGWQANLQYRRELFRKRVREHLDRIKKRKGE